MSATGRVSVIIITWNSQETLDACIASFFRHVPETDFEIILVDNDSRDKGYLKKWEGKAGVTVILNPGNFGYARASNIGLAVARGENLLILNPDITLTSNPFPPLLNELERRPEIGVIGPLLYDALGMPQIEGYYPRFPTAPQYLLHHSMLARFSAARAFARRFFHPALPVGGLCFVDQIPGAFLLFRKDLFAGSPRMNEAYFLWMEDVDFCRRVHREGLKVAVLTTERATHVGGASFRLALTSWKRRVFVTSYLTYARLHFGTAGRAALALFVAADALARIAAAALAAPWRARDSLSRISAETAILRALPILAKKRSHPRGRAG